MHMKDKIIQYGGWLACIALIGACFLPWVHIHYIDETFTGFHVKRFATGTYYGRAGIPISILTGVIFIFMLLPKLWAKRINLFLAALLFAYCIRTYIVFTSSLFENEVTSKPGVYLIIVFSLLILVASMFPKMDQIKLNKKAGQ